jgi:hypothetical protein
LQDVTFYFDWFNNPEKEDLIKLLHLSRWFIDNKEIRIKKGFNTDIDEKHSSDIRDISYFLDINQKTEKRINYFFEDQFITLTENVLPVNKKYPDEFPEWFNTEELEKLKGKLCWIKVDFPEIFPAEHLHSTFCSPTAFPVINRKHHDSNRPYTLNKDLNIIPLITDDYFFSIKNIASSNHINYSEVPYRRVGDLLPGTYTIRTEGVKRFDERDANEQILYLTELLREEHVAFESIGSSILEKELDELQIILNRLQLNLSDSKDIQKSTHFILIKSEIEEDVWLEFWSTSGTFCNNIPFGTTCKHNEFDKKTLKLLTATAGGKEPPDQLERISIFKNELLTRNRIVTIDDIKAVCSAELGNELKDINIVHRPASSSNRNTGFQNCIHVTLTFGEGKSPEEKENLVAHMKKTLELKSSCIYKYKVEATM